MPASALTHYIDVAQITIWVFWFFFFGLVLWIRREDKREGYPAESLRVRGIKMMEGFPPLPKPKTFTMPHTGAKVVKPGPDKKPQYELKAQPIAPFPGAPLAPVGNPMLAGVGPGAYALRADEPDLANTGQPRIVPLRVAKHFSVVERDPDPRGMPVIGCDGEQGGVIKEIWVDRSEPQIRYLQLEAKGGKQVMLPITMCKVNGKKKQVVVDAITGAQFADAPTLKSYDQITLAEEDRVVAYYGAGTLYATPDRAEPFL